jgi:cytochrome c-type biogenesis protein CcmH/NrfF
LRDARTLAAVTLALLLSGTGAEADVSAEYDKAARTILCDCGCHPQSVHDCACGRAEQMRGDLLAEARSGKSGDQIVAEYVARGGEKVRVVPTATGFNLLAWIGPGLGFLAAGAFVALVLRRWRKKPVTVDAAPAPVLPADPSYAARLERELREHE